MEFRYRCGHVSITFIGTYDYFSCFRDSEISSGKSCISSQEFIPEALAGAISKICRITVALFTVKFLFKQFTYLLLRQMKVG